MQFIILRFTTHVHLLYIATVNLITCSVVWFDTDTVHDITVLYSKCFHCRLKH